MVKDKIQEVPLRRKREKKTNYKKRIALLKSGKPRLVVRKSLSNINAQIIEYKPEGDNVLVSANSRELLKMGYKMNRGNITSAYFTGMLLGQKAKKKNIKEAVLDIGLNKRIKGSKIYAVLKGVVDSGINIPCSKEIFPSKERIEGEHIADYAEKLKKENKDAYQKQFSLLIKNKVEDIKKHINETKEKIMKV
jgi:large subunit ribosomal protein L18